MGDWFKRGIVLGVVAYGALVMANVGVHTSRYYAALEQIDLPCYGENLSKHWKGYAGQQRSSIISPGVFVPFSSLLFPNDKPLEAVVSEEGEILSLN
ncbi:hypothetical protein HOD38_04490 [archaeon]|jgi:hypothetical protein|nr:hypothetical protein [archaeon]MBT4397500.1 hypothetical protein [archaeon]MBT4440895.1 hypothetical protein [archaeon]